MNNHKSILFISYYFPPVGTVGSLRNYNIARHLSKHFSSTHLITVKNKPFLLGDNLPLDFISVNEVSNFDYRIISNILSPNKSIANRINHSKKNKSVSFLRKTLNSFPANLLIGEGGMLYTLLGLLKAIRLVKKHNITHVYSSFRPYTDHYISYLLKKIFPKLIWIADFRDLQIDVNRKNVFAPKFQHWCNKRIISKANVVTTVSKGLSFHLKKYNENTIIIRNGIREFFVIPNSQKTEIFTITYTGSLYPGFQNPRPLFSALHQLLERKIIDENKITIVYAGKDNLIWDSMIKEFDLINISKTYKPFPISESISLQAKSNINLLLSWSSGELQGIITGKFYEYLAAQKPILLLINGTKDIEIEELFTHLNAGFIFYPNEDDLIITYIKYAYQEWMQNGEIKHQMKNLESISWKKSVQKLINYISI